MEGLLVGGMLIAILTGFIAYTASFALRPEITAADPGYAALLFRSFGDQVVFRQLPVRMAILYRRAPPVGVRSSVRVLRWAFGLFCVTFTATIGLALSAVAGLAA